MPAAIAVPLISAAVGAGATAYGAHSAGKSAKRAANVTAKADTDTLALERERDAEAKRQWDADQAQKAKEFAASEEERAFNRQQAEFTRQNAEFQQQLLREKEQRAAPYRAMSQQALGSLGSLLGLNLQGGNARTAAMGGQPMPAPAPPLVPRGGMQAPTLGDLIQLQQRGMA